LEFNRLLGTMLWAGRMPACPPACGERFKKGWRCSRDVNHDGPCALTKMPSRWQRVRRAIGTFIWAYAPRVHFGPCPDPEGCYC